MTEEIIKKSALGKKNEDGTKFTFPITTLKALYAVDSLRPQEEHFIAVKELIIQWTEFQTELCGSIESVATDSQLLTFSFDENRDRKKSLIKISNEEENFAKMHMRAFKSNWQRGLFDLFTTSMDHDIELEMKSLFGEDEILPIKNVHITVEIRIKRK